MFVDFREREGGRGWGREEHWCEKHWSVASHTCPNWGSNPQPRCVPALTGDQTRSLLAYRMMLQSTESHWPGRIYLITGCLYLSTPFTHFTHLPSPQLWQLSVCSLYEFRFCFCSDIPHISEIIWHLSLSNLFHKMPSSSIYVGTNGKILFFFNGWMTIACIGTTSPSSLSHWWTHVVSVSWLL